MATRYEQLRAVVANLAASAEEQIAYLDGLFVPCTGGGSAEAYGNVELIEEFDDIFLAHNHMLECGEMTQSEVDAVMQLDKLLVAICAAQDDELWARGALFGDDRWEKIRSCASSVFEQLPDERRESDYTRGQGAHDR